MSAWNWTPDETGLDEDVRPMGPCVDCGRPCRPEDAPRCLACTLLEEEETEETERWNYPEQHHEGSRDHRGDASRDDVHR